MNQWDAPDLVAAALKSHLENAMQCEVNLGWVGNKERDDPDGHTFIGIECGNTDRDPTPGEVVSHTTPAEGEDPVTTAVIDYGHVSFGITLNLYVVSKQRGKTVRALALRTLEDSFELQPGLPHRLLLDLSDPEATRAEITIDDVMTSDNAEGIRRDEWRAVIQLMARLPLRSTRQFPYCHTINLVDDHGDSTSVESVIPD